jgi:sugar phosphate permease
MTKRFFRVDRPFDARQSPVYYGWVVLFFGTLGMIAAIPGSPPGMSIFVDGMIVSLDMSRTQFSLSYTLGTITAGIIAPFAGSLVDRYGARLMGCISYLGLGLLLIFTGFLDRIFSYFGASVGGFPLAFILVFIAFAGIRLFGMSFGMTVCRSMVFRWFEGRRGWAAAINGVALSLSFSSAPVLLNGVVVSFGWQQTWLLLGVLFIVIMTLIAYVFFRDDPESCGIEVEQGSKKSRLNTRVVASHDYTAKQAMKTWVFWIFVSGLALNALIGTGAAFHLIAIGESQGVSRADAVAVFLPVAIFHVITTLSVGTFSDRIPLRYFLIFMVGMQTLGLYGLTNLGDPLLKWFYIAGSGFAWGAFGVLFNITWPRFYGRKYLGSINGWVGGITVMTSAMGPLIFGLSQQYTDSFATAIWICAAPCPLVLAAAFFARNPQRQFA